MLILDVKFHYNKNCQKCFEIEKEEINVIVYRIMFTKHSRALVSSSTIDVVLQLFSSFQFRQHNIMACVHSKLFRKNVILFNPSRNFEHMLSLLSFINEYLLLEND